MQKYKGKPGLIRTVWSKETIIGWLSSNETTPLIITKSISGLKMRSSGKKTVGRLSPKLEGGKAMNTHARR